MRTGSGVERWMCCSKLAITDTDKKRWRSVINVVGERQCGALVASSVECAKCAKQVLRMIVVWNVVEMTEEKK